MTPRTLAASTIVATPLLLATAVPADFLGFEGTALETTIAGYGDARVVRLYALFDDPGDSLIVIFGNVTDPLAIGVDGGASFFQSIFGGDRAPHCALIDVVPELEHDTFLDIGQVTVEGGPVSFSPGFPVFVPDALVATNGSWYRLPGDPLAVAGPDGRLFIGQFTFASAGTPTLSGTLNMTTVEGGVGRTRFGLTFTISAGTAVPRPCPSDVNEDDTVDVMDLVEVILAWGDCVACGLGCPADVTYDGTVDQDDIVQVVLDLGPACEP